MNRTVEYYNNTAKEYFDSTSQVDLEDLYERFLAYIPAGGSIMDLGCGSGRDVKWFRDHGYDAYGLDASEKLVRIACEKLEIPIELSTIEEWVADDPYDGIWCCASIMHLDDEAIEQFFSNLKDNLKPAGVLFMSVKSGIETGTDRYGRYLRDFEERDIHELLARHQELELKELWYTEDKLSRDTFKWLNTLIVK